MLLAIYSLAYSKTKEPTKKDIPVKGRFPYKLLATVLGSDSNAAKCVLLNLESGKQLSYKAGDKILDYQIAIITRGSITLLKNNKYSFLNLPLGNENKSGPGQITVKRNVLKKQAVDLNALFSQAQPVPFIESGKIIGLQIPPLKNKAMQYMLNVAGLKEGDVATCINGEKLSSLQKALEVYHKYKDQDKIEVEIKRGDAVRNLTYQID